MKVSVPLHRVAVIGGVAFMVIASPSLLDIRGESAPDMSCHVMSAVRVFDRACPGGEARHGHGPGTCRPSVRARGSAARQEHLSCRKYAKGTGPRGCWCLRRGKPILPGV